MDTSSGERRCSEAASRPLSGDLNNLSGSSPTLFVWLLELIDRSREGSVAGYFTADYPVKVALGRCSLPPEVWRLRSGKTEMQS